MRFLHTADWQLGMSRHFLDPERQGEFDAARRNVLGALGRVAQDEGCEAIVVCGDVFETNHVSARTIRQALDKLRDLGIPVYLLPGNHDPLNAGSIWTSDRFLKAKPENVHVLDRNGLFEVRPGFELVAAPWPSKQPTSDLIGDACSALEPALPGVIRVAVAHGSVDTEMISNPVSAIRHETLTAACEAGKIHYVALGDRHSTTRVGPRVWYSGAPEPTNFVEEKPGQVLVVEFDEADLGKPPTVTEHHVGTWRFKVVEANLTGMATIETLREDLDRWPDKDRTALKLAVTGALSVREMAEYEILRAELTDMFAAVVDSVSRTDLVVRPEDGDFASLGLTGFAALALDDLRAEAGSADPGTAQTASAALGLLVRLAGRSA